MQTVLGGIVADMLLSCASTRFASCARPALDRVLELFRPRVRITLPMRVLLNYAEFERTSGHEAEANRLQQGPVLHSRKRAH